MLKNNNKRKQTKRNGTNPIDFIGPWPSPQTSFLMWPNLIYAFRHWKFETFLRKSKSLIPFLIDVT